MNFTGKTVFKSLPLHFVNFFTEIKSDLNLDLIIDGKNLFIIGDKTICAMKN